MENKYLKFFIVLIVALITINLFTAVVHAASLKDDFTKADEFVSKGESQDSIISLDELQKTSSSMYNILLAIGVAVAVIGFAVLGIQFMIGGIEEKANIKEKLVPFIIGSVVVFGAFGIWKITVNLFKGMSGYKPTTTTTQKSSSSKSNSSSTKTSSSSNTGHGGGGSF